MNPLIFLGIGLLMVFMEFYIPGAVMGIGGGILILTSLVQFISQTDSGLAILAYLILIVTCLGLLVKFALWRIKRTPASRSIYSNADQEGYVASSIDKTAIGKKGIVLSDLKPGGYVQIEGKQHQALSQSGYLVKGTEILVIGGQEESLIVKKA